MAPLRRLVRRLLGATPAAPAPRAAAAAPRRPRPPEEPALTGPAERLQAILAYHELTRHHPGRYARGPGWMDWDTQPDPFRWYDGAPRVDLPRVAPGPEPAYEPPFLEGGVAARPLSLRHMGQLLGDALGLSAWKVAGEARWSLRVNPSSGNLHPTEGYVICGPLAGLSEAPGVWHYLPHDHALEHRARLPAEAWGDLPADAVLLGLSSIHWRESWKYGERALRYCHHDLGHALGTLSLAAAALGWRARLLEAPDDGSLARLLGLAGQVGPEAEHPDALVAITTSGPALDPRRALPPALLAAAGEATWLGAPRALSPSHEPWPAIDRGHAATVREGPPPEALFAAPLPPQAGLAVGEAPFGLREKIHGRRSAVDMDGRSGITRDAFLQILRKAFPGGGQVPFTTLPWRPRVHLALFVHRVVDVMPGLYLLARDPDPEALAALRAGLDADFAWSTPSWAPEGLPLFLLQEADVRHVAAGISCGQAIAGDGCFAVAMLGDFASLEALGPWFWRRLHWEAGLVGQVLYLEAEATGIQATGIGCFFDEETHRVLGLRGQHGGVGRRFRDLYHFTLGRGVDDPRIQTAPAYGHLDRLAEEAETP